jgi:uncharacterized membrane protein
MATISVLKFHTSDGAKQALTTVQSLAKQQLVTLQDAAIVTWPDNKKKPKTEQLQSMTGVGALGGAFWGMLFGLIFLVPFLGAAIGAGMGALMGSMSDVGIDDDFIKSVQTNVTKGTSALFLMTSDATMDKVVDEMKHYDFEIITTNLSHEQEDALRQAFADDDDDEATEATEA